MHIFCSFSFFNALIDLIFSIQSLKEKRRMFGSKDLILTKTKKVFCFVFLM